MARRHRFGTPYQQGSFDCLCGVYAIVNAFDAMAALNLPLGKRSLRPIFNEMITTMDEGEWLADATLNGIEPEALQALLETACRQLRKNGHGTVTYRRPFRCNRRVSKRRLREQIEGHVGLARRVALIEIDGLAKHWTVVTDVIEMGLTLYDLNRRELIRHTSWDTCTVHSGGQAYRLVPRSLFLLRFHPSELKEYFP